jgi:hypothetical protein
LRINRANKWDRHVEEVTRRALVAQPLNHLALSFALP